MNTLRPHYFALLLAPLVACGGQTLDVGSNPHGSAGSGASNSSSDDGTGATTTGTTCNGAAPPGPALSTWPDAADCQDGSSALQGTWSGYVQGPNAGAYPDRGNFTVTLRGDDATLCGTLTFGAPSTLAPATDPEASYPPGYAITRQIPIVNGYSYALRDVSVSGPRVQFTMGIAEPMRSWCQLQTPYYSSEASSWGCARNLDTSYTYGPKQCHQVDPCTGQKLVLSCDQLEICISGHCACNAMGCDGDAEAKRPEFDLRFTADEATGNLDSDSVFLTRE